MPTAEKLIAQFKDVQTLPHVISQLSKLIADSESTMKQFEEVIEMDPILVARLLKVVNSPFYGLMQKVDSISRAVAYLGMRNLHNIAVTESLKTLFVRKEDSSIFSRKQLWLHCAAVSICSKMIAERIFGINGDDAYLCGILHDFGLIVEEQLLTVQFLSICQQSTSTTQMLSQEQELLGTDHAAIGYLMTKEWAMPETIQQAIRDHHLKLDDVEPESLTGILQIAEYLTSQQNYTTLTNMQTDISPPLLDHIQEELDEYSILLEDFPEEMVKAQDLHGGTS